MILYPILLSILALAAGVWIDTLIENNVFNVAYKTIKK